MGTLSKSRDSAIRSGIADGSTYYTLAYYPQKKDWNGEFRRISVKVGRPAVKLRHRPGYYALNTPKDQQAVRRMFTSFGLALKPDAPVSTGIRFEAGMVQPSDKTGNKVLLNFALDPHTVRFEKQDDGLQHANVDCAVQAYDRNSRMLKMETNTLSVALDEPTFNKAMRSFLFARVAIDLSPGSYLLRLGLIDERTGLVGTADAPVTIAAPATAPDLKAAPQNP